MVPHVIRLHSAWQPALERGADCAPALVRPFGRPTGLMPDDRVWLVCDPALIGAALNLNGQRLRGSAVGEPLEFDITAALAERNELRLVGPRSSAGASSAKRGVSLPEGLVCLEIRSHAWIDDLGLTIARSAGEMPMASMAGTVTLGGFAGPMALVVAAQGRELFYAELASGAFRYTFAAPGVPDWRLGVPNALVEVEVRLLAAGHTCWQALLPTAVQPTVEFDEGRAVRVGPRELSWPAAGVGFSLASEPAEEARRLAEEGPLAMLAQLMPRGFYQACDASGLGLVQPLPAGAAGGVVRKLLRHPSILHVQQSPVSAAPPARESTCPDPSAMIG